MSGTTPADVAVAPAASSAGLRALMTRERWLESARIAGVVAVILLYYLGVLLLSLLLAGVAIGLYPLVKRGVLDLVRERKIGTEIFVTLATTIARRVCSCSMVFSSAARGSCRGSSRRSRWRRWSCWRGRSLVAASRTDALMTITAMPITVVATIALAIASIAGTPQKVMPIALAAAAVLISDVPSREKRAGTTGLVFAAPRLKARLVWWKLMSSALTALIILSVPVIRMIVARPSSAPYLFVGIAFIVAFATMLGIVSANPKTFLVLFLTFWYVVVNDGGHTPALDFAGVSGIATPAVLATYLTLALAAIATAEVFHRADQR